jgi:hypothetical protein
VAGKVTTAKLKTGRRATRPAGAPGGSERRDVEAASSQTLLVAGLGAIAVIIFIVLIIVINR